jgi:glyoxylase-like metal-dependent hydrolase (beta-lactamase superfamily II)
VADGVWGISSPRPTGGDAAVLYVVEGNDGVYLIDAGWSSATSLECLSSGLDQANLRLADIRGIALTHLHPDHCGLADEVRRRTGAWVAAHADEAAAAKHRHGPNAPFLTELQRWLPRVGVPDEDTEAMLAARRALSDAAPALEIDLLIADGDTIDLGGRELLAMLTPGHSVGHLCFNDEPHGLLFAGDVVLPKRLPPVGLYSIDDSKDPIATFFASLERVSELDGTLVLPGHGDAFVGPRADAERIRDHHERRMRSLLDFLEHGPATVWDAALAAPWTRPWSDLQRFAQLLGLGKVNAHLVALANRGLVERLEVDQARFALVGGAAAAGGRS